MNINEDEDLKKMAIYMFISAVSANLADKKRGNARGVLEATKVAAALAFVETPPKDRELLINEVKSTLNDEINSLLNQIPYLGVK